MCCIASNLSIDMFWLRSCSKSITDPGLDNVPSNFVAATGLENALSSYAAATSESGANIIIFSWL